MIEWLSLEGSTVVKVKSFGAKNETSSSKKNPEIRAAMRIERHAVESVSERGRELSFVIILIGILEENEVPRVLMAIILCICCSL